MISITNEVMSNNSNNSINESYISKVSYKGYDNFMTTKESPAIKYARFKLSDYHSAGLLFLTKKTGMDGTNIIRQAITEKIQKDLSPEEQRELLEFQEDIVEESWDEWREWNNFRDEMPKKLQDLWNRALFESMKLIHEKGREIAIEDVYKLKSVIELEKTTSKDYIHHGGYLIQRLMEVIFQYRLPLILPDEFEEEWDELIASNDEKIFQARWERLDARLRQRREKMQLAKLDRLRKFMREHNLYGERETALFLLDMVEKDDRLIRIEHKGDPFQYCEYLEKEMKKSVAKDLVEELKTGKKAKRLRKPYAQGWQLEGVEEFDVRIPDEIYEKYQKKKAEAMAEQFKSDRELKKESKKHEKKKK